MTWFQEVYVSTLGDTRGWHLALARQLGAYEGVEYKIAFEYGNMSYFGSTSCSLVGPDFADFLRCDEAHSSYELHQRLLEILPILSKAYPKNLIYMLSLEPWEVCGYSWLDGKRASESWDMLSEYAERIRSWKEDCL